MVIHKDHTKSIKWKTGVVIGLDPGKDGVVRRVLLRTANGKVIDRPVQRLHPIEVHDDNVVEQPADPIPPTAAAAATTQDEAKPDNPTGEEEEPLRSSVGEHVMIGPTFTTRSGRRSHLPAMFRD